MNEEQRLLMKVEDMMLAWLDGCEDLTRSDQQGTATPVAMKIIELVKENS